MVIDQSEIDALLAEASGAPVPPRPPGGAMAAPPPVRDFSVAEAVPPDVARLLRLRVPVIVRLAMRRMTIHEIRKISIGTIVEFEKPIEDPLDVLVNNRPIAAGETVKVGENFGIRLSAVLDPAQRIRSMGA